MQHMLTIQAEISDIDMHSADFHCVDETIDIAAQIVARANDIGFFMHGTSHQSQAAIKVIEWATDWVNTVKARIALYSPGDAMKMTEIYDLMHRIAFMRPADRGFLNNIVVRAFDAMIHGDKNVDKYIMFKLIRRAARQREKALFDKPLKWSCISLNDWYRQSINGFDQVKLSDYDILSRVNILLESDLYAYEGHQQLQFKRHIIEQYHYFLDSYEAFDQRTAAVLKDFILISRQFTFEKA